MRFINKYLDLFGFSASFLCAIHCMALPLVLSFGAIGSFNWLHSPVIEWSFIITALLFASWSLLGSYGREHKDITPLIVAGIGFTILALGTVLHHHHSSGHLLSAIGGSAIAYAHYINWKLSHTHLELSEA